MALSMPFVMVKASEGMHIFRCLLISMQKGKKNKLFHKNKWETQLQKGLKWETRLQKGLRTVSLGQSKG